MAALGNLDAVANDKHVFAGELKHRGGRLTTLRLMESAFCREFQRLNFGGLEDPFLIGYAQTIGELAFKQRLAYGVNFPEMFRQSARLVDKIFKGSKPGDLPVEQTTKFDLVINLKTAKALGLEVPATLLTRADEVIE
jgi:hypothetical protein